MKVLSIDVDYAFSPAISSYDDYIVGSRIDYLEQQKILTERGFSKSMLNYSKFNQIELLNYSKFNQIKKILSYFSKVKIVTIEHHQQIIDHIGHANKLDIQNIDHHHDIFYPGWHELETLDEGNWVYHLSKTNKLKSYTWFRNKDSEDLSNEVKLNFKYLEVFDLHIKKIVKPDIIILCSSPHWTFDSENILIKKLMEERWKTTLD